MGQLFSGPDSFGTIDDSALVGCSVVVWDRVHPGGPRPPPRVMRAIVLDASVIVDGLFDLTQHPLLGALLEDEDSQIYIPHVCDLEVTSALRKIDGAYVALAEALDATLCTADNRLARAIRTHTCVEVVEG